MSFPVSWAHERVVWYNLMEQQSSCANIEMVSQEWARNSRFPLLRFRSALHCGYSGITHIQDGLFFVLTRARTF
jgi:hypothetical protein